VRVRRLRRLEKSGNLTERDAASGGNRPLSFASIMANRRLTVYNHPIRDLLDFDDDSSAERNS
jgi:hypothetical protein